MPLAAGDRLGPYEILAPLGKGGMGEVYRARDTRLGREVAIKVSAEQFSERFEREAKAVAALNHPNICSLFDVGPNFIVMELVEGPTLAERIAEGPISLDEALHVAGQIADALQAAHDNAIVHRDLKPGNVKIKPDGAVKVLDFGLAKVGSPSAASQSENSPTLSMAATQAGMILGTAGYMSPEQARGKPVDKRADIWAFGVVLYEMLTGKRLFEGEDVVETLAAVVHKEPDWKLAPPRVQGVLQRCLVKDPKKRLRDISGVGLLLEQGEPKKSRGSNRILLWAGWAAAAVAIAAAVFVWAPWRTPPAPELVRFQVPPPEKATFQNAPPVLSPDGKKLAFIANAGTQMVWVRSFDTLEARPLPGTEGAAAALFWSPDSRSIAYWYTPAPFKLKRVEVAGGPPQTLCETPASPASGAWSPDGVIVFHNTGLVRV
ncbi:MAG TPA: protein kinase, partial [Bryobacteraceae bacterium]|nr:protein kinase [Bryobacteraceae bacterium]